MEIEDLKSMDLSSFTIKDLAKFSLLEIKKLARVLPDRTREPDVLKRAKSNADLINRLRGLSSVKAFLKVTGVEVGILVHHPMISHRKSLYVDSRGLMLVTHNEVERVSLDTEVELFSFQRIPTRPPTINADFVRELADLKPGSIVDHFIQALSKPIKVK